MAAPPRWPDKHLQDAESALATPARENPFRFEGFYYDANVKTYDIPVPGVGGRPSPDSGGD